MRKTEYAKIQTWFDPGIEAFVVELPAVVTLDSLKSWGTVFAKALGDQSEQAGLLFDSNQHAFESVECLKWLRHYLAGEPAVVNRITRVAFVLPDGYGRAGNAGLSEAYFHNRDQARDWLLGQGRT